MSPSERGWRGFRSRVCEGEFVNSCELSSQVRGENRGGIVVACHGCDSLLGLAVDVLMRRSREDKMKVRHVFFLPNVSYHEPGTEIRGFDLLYSYERWLLFLVLKILERTHIHNQKGHFDQIIRPLT